MAALTSLIEPMLIVFLGVVVGGIVAKKDIPALKAMGVSEVFRPGARLEDIVRYVKESAARKTL